ncbi:MAG: type II toxin-antitoxin system PemK/MazF family toxin [Gemmatimonadota bacterium]
MRSPMRWIVSSNRSDTRRMRLRKGRAAHPEAKRMVVAQGEVWWALKWTDAPGNVALTARLTGLPRESVANVSQIVALDRSVLTERTGKVPRAKLQLVLSGIDVVLGR